MSRSTRIVLSSGKRKTAIARATVKRGRGRVRINKVPLEVLEPKIARDKIMEPILLAGEILKEIDVNVKVSGGGYMGQAEATRTAIARALLQWTKRSSLRTSITAYDRILIVSDPRRKEGKKFGGPGARARDQKSYR